MRFFSNDKDSRDDQPRAGQSGTDQPAVDVQERAADVNPDQAHDEHPERVASDPVAVPQQRAGSPWSSTPDGTVEPAGPGNTTEHSHSDDTGDTADAELADQEREDNLRRDDSEVRHDGDDLVADTDTDADRGTHGAHAAEPVDLALDDGSDLNRTGTDEVREDTTPPDHAVADTVPDVTPDNTTTTYGPDGTVTSTDTDGAALKDDGGFSDPKAVDPATDKPLDSSDSAETAVAAVPVAVDKPADTTPADTVPTDTKPADTKPGAVAAPELGPLFAKDDAQTLHERWREVQLRFVDSPREATSEAAQLVDEAVEKLTASLRSQKDALTGDNGEDTEKLRMELRGYRDILNRILGL